MKIKLLSDRVLIDAGDAETKTETGLIISKSKDASDFTTGEVVAVGPGKTIPSGEYPWPEVPMNVKVGDKVVFQYGKAFHHEGKTYQLVNESDIIMIL